jgi:hypothetical protein
LRSQHTSFSYLIERHSRCQNIIPEASAPVHRDRDSGSFWLAGDRGAGERIGVEDSRLSVSEENSSYLSFDSDLSPWIGEQRFLSEG